VRRATGHFGGEGGPSPCLPLPPRRPPRGSLLAMMRSARASASRLIMGPTSAPGSKPPSTCRRARGGEGGTSQHEGSPQGAPGPAAPSASCQDRRPTVIVCVHLERARRLQQRPLPSLKAADKHRRADRHAALPRGAKRGARDGLDGGVDVGIRQHHGVVLGAHVGLGQGAGRGGAGKRGEWARDTASCMDSRGLKPGAPARAAPLLRRAPAHACRSPRRASRRGALRRQSRRTTPHGCRGGRGWR
jgi:hypothetical protein